MCNGVSWAVWKAVCKGSVGVVYLVPASWFGNARKDGWNRSKLRAEYQSLCK
jgi:hypothetical protein